MFPTANGPVPRHSNRTNNNIHTSFRASISSRESWAVSSLSSSSRFRSDRISIMRSELTFASTWSLSSSIVSSHSSNWFLNMSRSLVRTSAPCLSRSSSFRASLCPCCSDVSRSRTLTSASFSLLFCCSICLTATLATCTPGPDCRISSYTQ